MAPPKKRVKKPAIPQPKRVKYLLKDAEESFSRLLGFQEKIYGHCQRHGDPYPEDVDYYFGQLQDFGNLLIKLVHLDNAQLHHPFVQWLLDSGVRKQFLRKLHRGLEVGVKRGLESVKGVAGEGNEKFYNTLEARNILVCDRTRFGAPGKKPKSYPQIQQALQHRGLIKPMSRQAFHKMAQKLLSHKFRSDPFYATNALPPLPKRIPPEWLRAQELLQQADTRLKAIRSKRAEEFFRNTSWASRFAKTT